MPEGLVVGATCVLLALATAVCAAQGDAQARPLIPQIDGDWWSVAGDPDLGDLTDPKQQPVDFAVWQARDGTWQLWSCIRHTKEVGSTRLFHRWEGQKLTDPDWQPMGIAMRADPKYGEAVGMLQAPHVVLIGDTYHMLYGGGSKICLALSRDGKTFERWAGPDGKSVLFQSDAEPGARDPMAILIGDLWHCYYTANPEQKGNVYCRTSPDLRQWSESRVVAYGGRAGTGPWSGECPFVVHRAGYFYLFRTQRYTGPPQTSVYRSKDPLDFGVEDDKCFVCTLPVAAPEIITHEGQDYIACLLPTLKGMRITRLKWVEQP